MGEININGLSAMLEAKGKEAQAIAQSLLDKIKELFQCSGVDAQGEKLEAGTRYKLMDASEHMFTISWHLKYEMIKTHWEKPLRTCERGLKVAQ